MPSSACKKKDDRGRRDCRFTGSLEPEDGTPAHVGLHRSLVAGRGRCQGRGGCFFNDTATTEIYTLSLHDALPILLAELAAAGSAVIVATHDAEFSAAFAGRTVRSEEHTSELQSRVDLVCRLL